MSSASRPRSPGRVLAAVGAGLAGRLAPATGTFGQDARARGPLTHPSGRLSRLPSRLRLPSLTIRVRIALWFVVIMAAVLAVLSVAVYQFTRDSLLSELRRDVSQRSAELAATVGPEVLGGSLQTSTIDVFSQLDVYCQVVDDQGWLVASSKNLDGLRLPFAAAPAELQREQPLGKIALIVDQRPVFVRGSLAGYVIVGRSSSAVYWALSRLQGLLYPGAGLALLLAGVAGWLLVRRATRPLERLDHSAAAIASSQNHTLRLEYDGGPDEIGRLARTIDDMLDALESAHRQLESAHTQLETTSASQRQFLVDVSHELRTPLTIMLSSLDVLAKTGSGDPEFQAQALADLRAEADRMRRMVTQLLIMARSDVDPSIARRPVLLAEAVADACRQVRPNGHVEIDAAALEALEDVLVEGDADHLRQLFLILLDNALKYTPAGGRIDVSGEIAGDTAAVSVTDSGIGIAPSDVPRVFDRFFRAENAHGSDGNGLGLAIAQRIATMHHGQIHVTSVLGHGSSFTVTLPVLMATGGAD